MNDKIYPTIPPGATKDFFEIHEPLDYREIECTCKHPEDLCESCKLYFEEKYGSAIPIEGE
jgi:hypothetical protein